MLSRIAPLIPLSLLACTGKEAVHEFPAGLEPLEDNRAPVPEGTDDDPYPEELSLVSGHDETSDYGWAHAIGFAHADLRDTWAALQDPEVDIDRRRVQEWEVTEDYESGYDNSYLIHNVSHDIVTVTFDIAWRHGAVEGTADAPELVAIRWQKVEGTEFVTLLEGSALLEPVDDGVTQISLVEHLDSAGSGEEEDVEAYFTDLYASVLAWLAGEPLPTYE